MTLDKLFKLVVILIVCLIAGLFFYFGTRGAEETITRQEPDPERTATDDILGENIGITDSDNAGKVIESTTYKPLMTQTLGAKSPQGPATNETANAPTELSPRDQIHREIELERLRQVLEADLGDEMRTRELRRQAKGSPIGATQVNFTQSTQSPHSAQRNSQTKTSPLPGISPSQQLILDQLASPPSIDSAQRPALPGPPNTQVSDPVG